MHFVILVKLRDAIELSLCSKYSVVESIHSTYVPDFYAVITVLSIHPFINTHKPAVRRIYNILRAESTIIHYKKLNCRREAAQRGRAMLRVCQ